MSAYDDVLSRAAALLRARAKAATPGPWRLSNSRYGALVADQPHPDRLNPAAGGWAWEDAYGGCLVGESLMRQDREYLATLHPGVGLAIADWLDATAAAARETGGLHSSGYVAATVAYMILQEIR